MALNTPIRLPKDCRDSPSIPLILSHLAHCRRLHPPSTTGSARGAASAIFPLLPWCRDRPLGDKNTCADSRVGSELVKKPAPQPDSGVGCCSLLAYLSDRSLGFAPSAWLSGCSLRSFDNLSPVASLSDTQAGQSILDPLRIQGRFYAPRNDSAKTMALTGTQLRNGFQPASFSCQPATGADSYD